MAWRVDSASLLVIRIGFPFWFMYIARGDDGLQFDDLCRSIMFRAAMTGHKDGSVVLRLNVLDSPFWPFFWNRQVMVTEAACWRRKLKSDD